MVGALVPDAGVQRDAVVRGGSETAPIRLTDLGDRNHLIGAGTKLGGELDGVSCFLGMDLSEAVVGSSVMGGKCHVSVSNRSFLKMARAFLQHGAVRPLVNLDRQTNGGDLQGAKAAI